MPEIVVKNGIADIEVFSKADMTDRGGVASEYPAWYFTQHKDELEEGIRYKEEQLKRGAIPESERPYMAAELDKERRRLEMIKESAPRLSGKDMDTVAKASDELGKSISESMFTRSEMKTGLADAHEEARRMSEPCIKLSGDQYVLAKKLGCRVSNDGKVSRIDAERVWKVMRRMLGETSNTESLRRG